MADGIKDFSKRDRQPPKFRVGDHMFFGVPALAAQSALDITKRFGSLSTDSSPADQVVAMEESLGIMLQPDSLTRFRELMQPGDSPDVIDMEQLDAIITWLLEQYGMRPTQPSDSSVNGSPSPDSGTPSTDAAPSVESIHSISPSIAS